MNTPILDFVKAYHAQQNSRFHMPGHKGVSRLGCEPWDITEINGADDLYHAEDIILASERNASSLFGTRHTFYSTEGSSLCIRAMLYLAQFHAPRRSDGTANHTIWAARNAHKTFLYGCALLDLEVKWLYPENQTDISGTASICSCPISPETLQRQLAATPKKDHPMAVFVTSPDYLGGLQDIAGLAEVCHAHDIPLLVDNAHGAYLKFLEPSIHPMDLGADMCCDSAHKTLPALTGCAYLHINNTALYPYEEQARQALALFGSTSPSYLLLQSLDYCNAVLADRYESKLTETITRREQVCAALQDHGFILAGSDPLRIVLDAAAMGCDGCELAGHLRAGKMECEYADQNYVVLMVSPDTQDEDWEKLASLLPPAASKNGTANPPVPGIYHATPSCALSIRQALLAPSEILPLDQALGRICAAPVVSCPPAIPLAISGERITEEVIALCRHYGIHTLQVVKSPL